MAKYIRVYLSESDYDLLSRIAKSSGKGISTFAREVLVNSVKQEIKETSLLNQLIQKIEKLSEPQQENSHVFVVTEIEKLRENFAVILDALVILGDFFFVDRTKAEKFMQRLSELREKIELH